MTFLRLRIVFRISLIIFFCKAGAIPPTEDQIAQDGSFGGIVPIHYDLQYGEIRQNQPIFGQLKMKFYAKRSNVDRIYRIPSNNSPRQLIIFKQISIIQNVLIIWRQKII